MTIAGESAGSISVSAQMASPLSRKLIAGAIGESGALISTLPPRPLAETEQDGAKFAAAVGANSLAALRAMTAEQIQEAASKGPGMRFSVNLDGYFLPKLLASIFEAGEQAKIPLLAGSNSEEQGARSVLGTSEPTPENFANAVRKLYGENAGDVLKVYSASTPDEVLQAATDLASARFTGHSTWKWTELQMKTGGKPVYRYYYTRVRPAYLGMPGQAPVNAGTSSSGKWWSATPRAARRTRPRFSTPWATFHLDKRYAWEPADYKVSEIMQNYFANFIKSGNPNGTGLPNWPAYSSETNYQRMRLDVEPRVEPEPERARYLVLDKTYARP